MLINIRILFFALVDSYFYCPQVYQYIMYVCILKIVAFKLKNDQLLE